MNFSIQTHVKKLLHILMILALASCSQNERQDTVITTNNVGLISENLTKIDQNTLVIFDCDDTLISFKDAVLRSENETFLKKMQLTKEEQKAFLKKKGIVLLNSKRELVNDKLPIIIKNTQRKKAKVLLITAAREQNCGKIQSVLTWRINDLRSFGFYFDISWPNLNKANLGSEVWFDKGIVFAGKIEKSKALEKFLAFCKFTPNKIIFIDDKKKNIEDMKSFCAKKALPFIGIHYTEAAQNGVPFSEQRAIFQINYLKKYNLWLSDREADKLSQSHAKTR